MIQMNLSEAAEALNASLHGDDVSFSGCSIDTRTLTKQQLFIAIEGEQFDGHDFIDRAQQAGAAALLISKKAEASLPYLLVEDTRLAMGSLASYWRKQFDIPVVAITGSNGKTTVKEMLISIVQQNSAALGTSGNYNNDIGLPLTLFQLNDKHQLAILEMGANHAGEIDYLSRLAVPEVAVITQCAPAHLEGFGSIEGVAHAKSEIFHGLVDDGTAVINADDNYADFWLQKTSGFKQTTFGINAAADVYAEDLQASDSIYSFDLNIYEHSAPVSLKVAGIHNVMNALAASSCAHALGINIEIIKQGLEHFTGVNGRMQFKQARSGARLIDDTYNANLKSFSEAINTLSSIEGDTWLVVGDMGELGDSTISHHQQTGVLAKQAGIKHLVSVGVFAEHTSNSFGKGVHFPEKSEAVKYLEAHLTDKSVVLVKGSRTMKMEEIINALVDGGNG